MACLYSGDRMTAAHKTNGDLTKIIENHRTVARFQSARAWGTRVCSWPALCAYKSIIRQEARRRGLL